jgi:HD-like signal output (HDOD) protein
MTPAHSLITSIAEKINLPDVYLRVRDLIIMPDATIDDYVEVINNDSALAARIIRITNSRFFCYLNKAKKVK